MTAIFRRELRAYFYSPIGYVILAVFYVFTGLFFLLNNLLYQSADLTPVFSSLFTIVMFIIPILTMRLLSEDRKYKTDQALLTAPVTLTGLVLGKFLAAVAVYAIGLLATLADALIVAAFVTPNWMLIFGNFAAILLMGMALISIGLFISSLTENQVIAAMGTFAVVFILLMIDLVGNYVNTPILRDIIVGLSFYTRYTQLTAGRIALTDALFFLSASAVFVFLTVRVQERRRWS